MDLNHPGPATDSQNAPASVADFASTDPAILQKELAARKDDYLRLAADFDNFKMRTRRDSERHAAAEKEAFIGYLLPALDNLERALASACAAPTCTAIWNCHHGRRCWVPQSVSRPLMGGCP